MKILMLAIFVTLLVPQAFASEELGSKVLAENRLVVGFAPPEHTGVFKTQILTSGKVLHIDNHGRVTTLAALSPALLKKLKASINTMGDFKVIEPEGPICMDAPGHSVTVKVNKKDVRIWSNNDCRDVFTDNYKVNQIAQSVKELTSALTSLNSVE